MVEREEELIKEFQSGRTEAFDELMISLQSRALNLAYYRTGNRDDALDIVQEAFIRLYRVLSDWKPKAAVYTWLYRVIINLSIDRGRKKKRWKQVSLDSCAPPPEKRKYHHPRQAVEDKEIGAEVARAVAGLPDRQKSVFILRHYNQMSLKEIARVEKCSLGAVKANLFHAVRKLRDKLKNYY